MAVGPIEAAVFDVLYTLVHPAEYPNGGDRITWLAGLLGIATAEMKAQWAAFEPQLESGRAPAIPPLGPELTWLTQLAADVGTPIRSDTLALVERQWDLTQRQALLDPSADTIEALAGLRSLNLRIAALSNTHGLELRTWTLSPLAGLVDAVGFSHQIGAVKPARAAYTSVLHRLGVAAGSAAYVGDGSNDELLGARRAGFALVILAAEAASRFAPDQLPTLSAQADLTVRNLKDLPTAITEAVVR